MSDRIFTEQELRDREEFKAWMKANDVSVRQVAEATGFKPNYIYMMIASDRTISEAFKWKFGVAYGHDVAGQLFGEAMTA